MGDNLVPFPGPVVPTMFCGGCGADRTVPPSAADPGPCPSCGSTLRSSCRPGENGFPGGLTGATGLPVEFLMGAGGPGDDLGAGGGIPWYASNGGGAA